MYLLFHAVNNKYWINVYDIDKNAWAINEIEMGLLLLLFQDDLQDNMNDHFVQFFLN
jgi:hypothetical protein